MIARVHPLLRLLIGLAALASFVGVLHLASQYLPGATGEIISDNRRFNREVYGYVYSDVTNLDEFLDDTRGKYGKQAIRLALGGPLDPAAAPQHKEQ